MASTGNNMVHHYFSNKQGLLDAIISQFSTEVFNTPVRIMQKIPQTQAEFVSRFELFVEETLEAMIANRHLFVLLMKEELVVEDGPYAAYHASFISFFESAKGKGFVNEEIDGSMLTGLVLDRLGNQVIYANMIKQSTGTNVISDADYKARWLRANLNVFLHGLVKSVP